MAEFEDSGKQRSTIQVAPREPLDARQLAETEQEAKVLVAFLRSAATTHDVRLVATLG